ncbi:MAG: hypothetical protein VW518_00420 [Burkholderiaceae bacterium]
MIWTTKLHKSWSPIEIARAKRMLCIMQDYFGLHDSIIEVHFKKANKDYYGLTEKCGKHHVLITLYKNKEIKSTVVHEMTHAKQFIRKELGYQLQWKRSKKWQNAPYYEQPWEKEAIKMEALFSK